MFKNIKTAEYQRERERERKGNMLLNTQNEGLPFLSGSS
jgi:hypothetical protein